MRFWKSLALSATVLLASSCSHNGPVTRGEIFLEIPFEDGAEGAGIDVVTHQKRLVSAEEWKKMRPTMLMIPAKYWTDIKTDWLKACRIAGPDCNVMVDSVDKVIRALDEIMKRAFPLLKK